MEKEKLFQEFPAVSTADWKEKITKDLKGADYERKLVWRTPEGFKLQPFYRAEDLEELQNLEVCPGDFPYLRGRKVKGNQWLVRQDILVKDVEEANLKALDIRMKGVDSLGFILDDSAEFTESDIEKLLHNIRLDVMELNYSSARPVEMVSIVESLAKKYNRDLDKIKGSVEFDPIGNFSLTGTYHTSKEGDFKLLEELIEASKLLPEFQVITVDGSIFQNSGSGIVSQLAFTLSKGAEYLTYLTDKGYDIDTVAPKLRFKFAVGSSYFMEIAKFRAARYLWANIVNAYGLNDADNAAMFIHCTNTQWNKTLYDPYVNMLRTTSETMSALTGGVDSMTVAPFDEVFETPTDFSERIARNQQLLLKGESYLDKVNDPAAGSYYIEQLTNQIIQESWKLFVEIDEMGGFSAAFEKGFIQEKTSSEAAQKSTDIASRKRILLGTNQFPNINEHIDEVSDDILGLNADDGNTLHPFRGSQAFEQLRFKTDKFAQSNARPKVWMFTYGNSAMRNARAQFAANFFACAGFDIINNAGFQDIEKGIKAAKSDKPEIVVICSSDDDYAANAIEIYDALKTEAVVVLAGFPKDLVDQFKSKGFDNFIHVKSNVLDELSRYQKMLSIG